MTDIALFLDEDVRMLLAEVLRQRGFDVAHVVEEGRQGKSDREQLGYAVSQGRTLLTHNIRDFLLLDRTWREEGRSHRGIIVSDQLPFRELLRRTLRCLSRRNAAEVCNQITWLHIFK